MFRGLVALLGRSLRIDSRSWQVHLARVGLMLGIYIALASTFATSSRFGAPGLRFFRAIIWLNVAFMTLLGVGFFSTTVTEEKEEDTLGLMQMAGINPLGILLGKVGGRLCQALLLIAVQYPFTLLAVTLGGVTANQVRCAFVGLTAFMMFLAGLGTLCSTVAPRNRTAGGMMILGLLIYLAVPYGAYELHKFLTTAGILAFNSKWAVMLWETASMSLYLQVNTIMASSFNESPWSTQAISNLIGCGLCFTTAWALFPVCTHNPATESATRGLVSRKHQGSRWLAPGRTWMNPFAWKDFHFVGGGIGMILARTGFYLAILLVAALLAELWWGGSGTWRSQYPYQWAIGIYQFFLLFIITIEVAVLLARALHDEIRGQTLATLIMLPESPGSVVYSKLMGTLLAGLPGMSLLIIASAFTAGGRENTSEFLEHAAGWFFLAHFALVPHLSMLLALYLRWGCVPLSIGLGAASMFGWVAIFEANHIGQRDAIVGFVAALQVAVCAGCHYWVVRQLPHVAARG